MVALFEEEELAIEERIRREQEEAEEAGDM